MVSEHKLIARIFCYLCLMTSLFTCYVHHGLPSIIHEPIHLPITLISKLFLHFIIFSFNASFLPLSVHFHPVIVLKECVRS